MPGTHIMILLVPRTSGGGLLWLPLQTMGNNTSSPKKDNRSCPK